MNPSLKTLYLPALLCIAVLPGMGQLTQGGNNTTTLNSTITYPSASVSGGNNSLTIGSSGQVTVTGNFTWLDQAAYINIATGGSLSIGGDLLGDGNVGTNNNYYPCISTPLSTQTMLIDCHGNLTVTGNLGAGSSTKRFKNWVILHIYSGATVTLNGNDNVLGPRGIIYVHSGGKLIVNGTNLLVEFSYSRLEIESGATVTVKNLIVNGNGTSSVTSACSTNPAPYNGTTAATDPPFTALNVNGSLTVINNLSINNAAVSAGALTQGTGHFTIGSTGSVSVSGNFVNGSSPSSSFSDTTTVNGTLTVSGNVTNNSVLNVNSGGVFNISGNVTNNSTASPTGVSVIAVSGNMHVSGSITNNDIVRAICPTGSSGAVINWGSSWLAGSASLVQNPAATQVYYFGVAGPPGTSLNLCSNGVVLGDLWQGLTARRTAITSIVLNWEVAADMPVSSYIIQRSADGVSFGPIGETAVVPGQASYSYTDAVTPAANLYYRLVALSNGFIQYSKIITVTGLPTGNQVELRPSISTEAATLLFLNSPTASHFALIVSDRMGAVQLHKEFSVRQGENFIRLDLPGVARGTYYIHIAGENGLNRTLPFVRL